MGVAPGMYHGCGTMWWWFEVPFGMLGFAVIWIWLPLVEVQLWGGVMVFLIMFQ